MARPEASPRLRSVALPVEHGGWGFLGEPLVLGLALAPSLAGVALAVAAAAAFLIRHPLRLVMGDRRRGSRYPRTALAERVAAAYLVLALAALLVALALTAAPLWLPIGLAAPLAALQLYHDARGSSRHFVAEVSGSVALASTVAVISLAGGRPVREGLLLWLVLAARAATAILYVRTRIRMDRENGKGAAGVVAAHLLGLALVGSLAALGELPWLAPVALAVLCARAVYGVSPLRRPLMPRELGVQELGFGTLTVLLLALGYRLGG